MPHPSQQRLKILYNEQSPPSLFTLYLSRGGKALIKVLQNYSIFSPPLELSFFTKMAAPSKNWHREALPHTPGKTNKKTITLESSATSNAAKASILEDDDMKELNGYMIHSVEISSSTSADMHDPPRDPPR